MQKNEQQNSRTNKQKIFTCWIITAVLSIVILFILRQNPFGYNLATKNTDYRQENSTQFEIEGGDIVVFGTHVAIVSDKRNSKGIPYIIHLVSPVQKAYEQDGMEHWEKKASIMGHYRIGK